MLHLCISERNLDHFFTQLHSLLFLCCSLHLAATYQHIAFVFVFIFVFLQGFKAESCISKSFPLLPPPHLARPQVCFLGSNFDKTKKKRAIVKGTTFWSPSRTQLASTKGFYSSSHLLLFLLRLEVILLEGNLLTQVPVNCKLTTNLIKVPICLGNVATLREVTLR